MKDVPEFVREYFLQTRREIDAEKSSRDQLLNFVIVAIGAVGFAVFQNDKAESLLASPCALILEFLLLVAVTSLFWLRRKKLQQIADRWFVLESIVAQAPSGLHRDQTLEAIVCKDLRTTRYTRKDAIVCIGMSAPIYGLMAFSLWQTIPRSLAPFTLIALMVLHARVCWLFMARPFDRPEPLATYTKGKAEQGAAPNGGPATQHGNSGHGGTAIGELNR